MPFVNNNILYYRFNNLLRYESAISHFVSTRIGANNDKNFTIGLNGFIPDEEVLKNREVLANEIGLKPSAFVFAEQVHGSKVEVITPELRGRGAFSRLDALQHSDAWITSYPNICLVAQAADCVPILFLDPVKNVIGAAHAGWKGTVKRIAAEVVLKMGKEYGTNPADLLVGIGPSAGPCCYEVGSDVLSMVNQVFPNHTDLIIHRDNSEKPFFSLWQANVNSLLEVGVELANIELSGICTICNNQIFFSARRGDRGRFGGGIMIKG